MQFLAIIRSISLCREDAYRRLASTKFRRTAFTALLALFLLSVGIEGAAAQDATPPPAKPDEAPASPGLTAPGTTQVPASAETPAAGPNPSPAGPTPADAAGSGIGLAQETPLVPGGGELTEDELRQRLVGKQLFLRDGYQGDSISFNEHGVAIGHPVRGSFALSAVEIQKVHLAKHKIELEGDRYALHFLTGLPDMPASKDIDRVRITPKKKILKISIDREKVLKAKVAKEKKGKHAAPPAAAGRTVASSETDAAAGSAGKAVDREDGEKSEDMADQPAEPASVTTTTSQAHADLLLRQAIDRVFTQNVDANMQQHLPQFWQLYFQAQRAGVEYRSQDPSVLRPSAVDQQAKTLSPIAPQSSELAQSNGISGRALYRAVIDQDGKPTTIAVVRPIGFGLDEKAVEAIQKAKFQPAMKGGQPVAEVIDLAVMFRLYSGRTKESASEAEAAPTSKPVLPGPYSVKPSPGPQ